MAVVRIPDSLRDELAEMDLVIWHAMHPMIYPTETAMNSGRGHHDKTRVEVQLSGPGMDRSPWGRGPNLQAALNDALSSPLVIDRVRGLKGALMRLDAAVGGLSRTVMYERLLTEQHGYDRNRVFSEDDDEIPF